MVEMQGVVVVSLCFLLHPAEGRDLWCTHTLVHHQWDVIVVQAEELISRACNRSYD